MSNPPLKIFKTWLTIVRPFNLLITTFAVFIGALLTGNITPLWKIFLAMLSAASICAGGNVLNDYFDVQIDRINKPDRPIPSGKIKRKSALLFSIILMVIGTVISFFISLQALLIASSAVILLLTYNANLKKKAGIVGNITVSFTAALSVIYGGIAVGRIEGTLFPSLFAFLFHLGREIIKDIEDTSGDRVVKSCSIPARFSPEKSYYIGFIPLFLLIAITPLPYVFEIYNLFYLLVVIPLVDILLLFSFFFFRKKLNSENLHKLSNIIKLGMVFGLISLITGII